MKQKQNLYKHEILKKKKTTGKGQQPKDTPEKNAAMKQVKYVTKYFKWIFKT